MVIRKKHAGKLSYDLTICCTVSPYSRRAHFATNGAFCHYSVMNELLLLAWLASAPPASACCAAPAQVFTAPDQTSEMIDRVGHVISPMVLTTSFYGAALYLGADNKTARWVAVGLSVATIVAKELYDQRLAGRFGYEEAAIGLGGTALGLLIAERIEWPEEKRAK